MRIKLIKMRSERGQSLTELAISFVVLVLILAVGVDLGRMYFSYIAIREAAQEGALYGSINPEPTAITQRVRTSSSAPVNLSDTSNVSVSVSGGGCAGGTLVVTVTDQFRLTMPLIGALISAQTFPISVSATTTILAPGC